MDSGLDLTLHAGELAIFVRLLIAVLTGAAVGWNHFLAGKSAGVGTHTMRLRRRWRTGRVAQAASTEEIRGKCERTSGQPGRRATN